MTSSIIPIKSIAEINLKEASADNSLKVLALDFDHNLAISDSVCSSDHFNDFMNEQNKAKSVFFDAHASLLQQLRSQTKFVATETGINDFIGEAKLKGWKVVVLTARPTTMLELTARNIAEAGFTHLKDTRIICEGDKKKALHTWLNEQPEIKKVQKIFIRFVDDKTNHCQNVASLSLDASVKMDIRCYHNQSHSTTKELSVLQQKILIVQLAAFKTKFKVPKDGEVTSDAIKKALAEFQIKDSELLPDGATIYKIVQQFIK